MAEHLAGEVAVTTEPERSLFVLGSFSEQITRSLAETAASLGVSTTVVDRCDEAPAALGRSPDPLAIVLKMDAEGAAVACAHVRAQARLAQLPILCVAPQRDDIAFNELFSWGADDLVAHASAPSLARRLRPLLARAMRREQKPPCEQGAVVAGSDARWRSVMGRALYQGGFSVRFVNGAGELTAESLAPSVRVIVLADDVEFGGAETAVTTAQARGSEAAWIIVAPPKRMAALHASIGGLPRVAVADGYAPPENVLFLTNELLARRGVNQRASVRVLYGTTVAFRVAGRDEDEIGFSYNVSAGGLYVRTLAPPEAAQELWLEMWPPRSERRVRLAGTVAWRRAFASSEGATVPAGFGFKINDGLAGDFDRWRAGYEAFLLSLLGARVPAS